jgi:hypothetical protein
VRVPGHRFGFRLAGYWTTIAERLKRFASFRRRSRPKKAVEDAVSGISAKKGANVVGDELAQVEARRGAVGKNLRPRSSKSFSKSLETNGKVDFGANYKISVFLVTLDLSIRFCLSILR